MPPKKPGPKKGDPRCKEYGRMGGQAVKEQYGVEFFKVIGAKGGRANLTNNGLEHLSEIGRKGGEARGKKEQHHVDQ